MNRPAIYFCIIIAMLTFACGKMSSPTQSRQSSEGVQGLQAGKAIGVASESQQAVSGTETVDQTKVEVIGAGTFEERLAAFSGTSNILDPKHHGPNHPPVMNPPFVDGNRVLLLPRGPAALVEFAGEPARDPDGDELAYRFAFALFDMTGIQTPEEALLQITRAGNDFEIEPDGLISPSEFIAVYGDHANISGLPGAIRASDGIAESGFELFNLDVVYDASAQYSAPAEYVSDQRWEYPEPIEWYEGTSAPVGGVYPIVDRSYRLSQELDVGSVASNDPMRDHNVFRLLLLRGRRRR